jgi:hypothetical protein
MCLWWYRRTQILLRLGPFTITKKISSHAYRLELPKTMKIHNVFHINLLSAASEDTDFDRRQVKPPPVITAEGEEEYEVEKIINWEQRKDGLYYQIRWTGYGPHEDTMERAEKIGELQEVMKDFLKEHPDAPIPKTYKQVRGYKKTAGRTANLSIQLPTLPPTPVQPAISFNPTCLLSPSPQAPSQPLLSTCDAYAVSQEQVESLNPGPQASGIMRGSR